jgi:hypothetical protein
MKPKEKSIPAQASDREFLRTGEILARAGIYLIRCTRDGCCAVDKKSLPQGSPAPPCLRCCNPAKLRFLHDEPAKEVPPETAPRPVESLENSIAPPASPADVPKAASIHTKEIVPKSGIWSLQCDGCGWNEEEFQHKGAWADPCSRCKSAACLSFLSESAAPSAEAKALGPSALQAWGWHDVPNAQVDSPLVEVNSNEKPIIEAPAAGEVKPSLMQRLTSKKSVDQKAGAKLGRESSRKKV